MTTASLPTRDDTLLGVCQGIGEDVGFNANWLRVALGAVLLVSPILAIGAYLALGFVLMIARWGWPVAAADEPVSVPPAATGGVADNDDTALARAA